jgi:hypothetical protein
MFILLIKVGLQLIRVSWRERVAAAHLFAYC